MRKKTLWLLVSCVMALSLVLASCGPAAVEEEPTKPEPTKPTPPEEKGPTGEVWYAPSTGTFSMRRAIDPHTSIGSESTTLNTMLFDGLTTKNGEGKIVPALAKSWKIAEDWSHMDITLQEGVKFHNGDPLTAKDVKFSIDRATREDMMHVIGYELRRDVDRVEVVDDCHLTIYFKQPYPAFLNRCALYLGVIPKDYIEKVGDEGFAANPVGAGPFKIIDFEQDNFANFEAVADHYRKPPYVEKFHFVICEEPATRLAMLKTGEADFILLNVMHVPEVQEDPDLRIIWSKHVFCVSMVFLDLAFPDEPSPFHDPRVRQAASLAIDRAGIAHNILSDSVEAWGSFLPPYVPGYKRIEPDPYDPEKAKELLAEAGYPDGFDTTFTCGSGDKSWMEPIPTQLNEVGIRAEFVVLEQGTWQKKFVGAELRGLGYAPGPWWVGKPHPGDALMVHTTGSWAPVGRTMPDIVDAVVNINLAVGDEAIADAARKAERVLQESGYRVPIWSYHAPYAVGPRIESYEPVPGGAFPVRMEYLKLKAE